MCIQIKDVEFDFDFIECFTTTFLHAHSWLNWVDEDDDEVGLKEKPEDTRYIKKIQGCSKESVIDCRAPLDVIK